MMQDKNGKTVEVGTQVRYAHWSKGLTLTGKIDSVRFDANGEAFAMVEWTHNDKGIPFQTPVYGVTYSISMVKAE